MPCVQIQLGTTNHYHEGRAVWTPKLPLADACQIPAALSCTRVDAPVCRYPCDEMRKKSARSTLMGAGSIWPRGGALCKHPEEVPEGERTCESARRSSTRPRAFARSPD